MKKKKGKVYRIDKRDHPRRYVPSIQRQKIDVTVYEDDVLFKVTKSMSLDELLTLHTVSNNVLYGRDPRFSINDSALTSGVKQVIPVLRASESKVAKQRQNEIINRAILNSIK